MQNKNSNKLSPIFNTSNLINYDLKSNLSPLLNKASAQKTFNDGRMAVS